jgi:hypothetical protein
MQYVRTLFSVHALTGGGSDDSDNEDGGSSGGSLSDRIAALRAKCEVHICVKSNMIMDGTWCRQGWNCLRINPLHLFYVSMST